MHEAQLQPDNAFVTLTYSDDHYSPSLHYPDFQRFMKRLRHRISYFDVQRWRWLPRYFMCGEYGEQTLRPHFHFILFGYQFRDLKPIGKDLYTSPMLERLWEKGNVSVGQASYESAGYCARYACKKVSGPRAGAHYTRVDFRTGEFVQVMPEFGHMSLKPGVGYDWFVKNWREVFRGRDGVVVDGRVIPAPRFYDLKLKEIASDVAEGVTFDRYVRSDRFRDDCTVDRLAVREKCAKAKLDFLKRSL